MKNATKGLSHEDELMVNHMRNDAIRREKDRIKNKNNLLIRLQMLEEKKEADIMKEKLPPPDFKEMFFTTDGKPIILKHDFILAKKGVATR